MDIKYKLTVLYVLMKDKVVWFFLFVFSMLLLFFLVYERKDFKYNVEYEELSSVYIVSGKGKISGKRKRRSGRVPNRFDTFSEGGVNYRFSTMLLPKEVRLNFKQLLFDETGVVVKYYDMCPSDRYFLKLYAYCLIVFEIYDVGNNKNIISYDQSSKGNTVTTMHGRFLGLNIKYAWQVVIPIFSMFFILYVYLRVQLIDQDLKLVD